MPGIHHVTAIAGDPLQEFRVSTRRDLGLRFVKKTVNFDDPSTYHFYLRRRDRQPRHHPDLLPLGRSSGRTARRRRNAADRFPCAAALARLLDPAFHRKGHCP